jgi:hypothetical protein
VAPRELESRYSEWPVSGELVIKERARFPPVALDGTGRAVQDVGGLLNRQAGEEPQFDQPAEWLVNGGKLFERFVQGHDFRSLLGDGNFGFVERDVTQRTATLGSGMPPSVIDDKLTHCPGGECEEVMPVLDREVRMFGELEIRLVHERGGLQRFASRAELPVRQMSKLIINQRQQPLEGLMIARAPRREQLADIFCCHRARCRPLYRLQ